MWSLIQERERNLKRSFVVHLRLIQKKFGKFWSRFKKIKNSEENKTSLDRLYEYFKELNSSENEASSGDFSRIYSQNGVDLLNSEITEDEVIKAVKNVKNSKAPGLDDIVNECLKTT